MCSGGFIGACLTQIYSALLRIVRFAYPLTLWVCPRDCMQLHCFYPTAFGGFPQLTHCFFNVQMDALCVSTKATYVRPRHYRERLPTMHHQPCDFPPALLSSLSADGRALRVHQSHLVRLSPIQPSCLNAYANCECCSPMRFAYGRTLCAHQGHLRAAAPLQGAAADGDGGSGPVTPRFIFTTPALPYFLSADERTLLVYKSHLRATRHYRELLPTMQHRPCDTPPALLSSLSADGHALCVHQKHLLCCPLMQPSWFNAYANSCCPPNALCRWTHTMCPPRPPTRGRATTGERHNASPAV
jgi:hypothetical protein